MHKGVSFNQLDDRNMGRIRYQNVSEADGEVVPAEHIVKGVEISKGHYVITRMPAAEPDSRARHLTRSSVIMRRARCPEAGLGDRERTRPSTAEHSCQ
jgi:hypothetical protein